jgi:predicted metal-dependent hydrolase
MIAKGIENANEIIEDCKRALAGLDSAEQEWKEILQSIITIMEDLKTKFFLKTNLAIPITNACRKDAAELLSLVENHDLSRFPEVLGRFRENMEKLLKQANMDGVIIT